MIVYRVVDLISRKMEPLLDLLARTSNFNFGFDSQENKER
jgi:hypothetical protein